MINTPTTDTPTTLESVKTRANLDESVLKALWNEIRFRNQNRIKAAIQGGENKEKAEQEFSTIPFEELLKKAHKEAA